VALIRTDFSEEHMTSLIRVKIICELGTTLAVTSKLKHARKQYRVCPLNIISDYNNIPVILRLA
jgi:hypothetical protein